MGNLGLGFSFHLGFWLKFMELILSFLINCIRFTVIESHIDGIVGLDYCLVIKKLE